MLRIAVQSKGRLFEETMALLQEADIKNFPLLKVKFLFGYKSSNFPHRGAFFFVMMIFPSL